MITASRPTIHSGTRDRTCLGQLSRSVIRREVSLVVLNSSPSVRSALLGSGHMILFLLDLSSISFLREHLSVL